MVTLKRDNNRESEKYNGFSSTIQEYSPQETYYEDRHMASSLKTREYDPQSYTHNPAQDYTQPSYTDYQREQEFMARLQQTNAVRGQTINTANQSYKRQIESSQLPFYNTTPIQTTKKKAKRSRGKLNTHGKIILAAYIGVVVLIATLIIINAEIMSASANVVTAQAPNYVKIPSEYAVSTNWFDRFCEFLTKVVGG